MIGDEKTRLTALRRAIQDIDQAEACLNRASAFLVAADEMELARDVIRVTATTDRLKLNVAQQIRAVEGLARQMDEIRQLPEVAFSESGQPYRPRPEEAK